MVAAKLRLVQKRAEEAEIMIHDLRVEYAAAKRMRMDPSSSSTTHTTTQTPTVDAATSSTTPTTTPTTSVDDAADEDRPPIDATNATSNREATG